MESSTKVGHIIKSFGKDGHMKMAIIEPYKNDIFNSKYLLVEVEGCRLPYFIEKIEQGLVKFDEVNSPESAHALSDCPIFLLDRDVTVTPVLPQELDVLKGFIVYDQNNKEVGENIEIVKMPQQLLLRVDTGIKTVLIPLHENLIVSINQNDKTIVIEIAEGLLDI